MQAAQNGTGNSADTEDGMRPDAQTVVDSSVELVEDTVAGGKELLRHLPSRKKFIKRDEHREAVRGRPPYAEYMEKRPQAVERPKRIAAETNLRCAETQSRNIRRPKTGDCFSKSRGGRERRRVPCREWRNRPGIYRRKLSERFSIQHRLLPKPQSRQARHWRIRPKPVSRLSKVLWRRLLQAAEWHWR